MKTATAKTWSLKLEIPLCDYLHYLAPLSNEPLTIGGLTAPFGLTEEDLLAAGISADEMCDFLLVGHVSEALAGEFEPGEQIDCVDVALAAADLGFTPAEPFLERGPYILAEIFSR